MSGVRNFTDLRIWRQSRAWAKDIYRQTRSPAFRSDRRLVAQVNDSAASVMANIAEGFGRGTQGEFVTFLGYSIGSLNETQSHLVVAYDRGHLSKEDYGELFQTGTTTRKQIVAFITSMVKPGSGVKKMRRRESWSEQVWEQFERITGQKRPAMFAKAQEPDETG